MHQQEQQQARTSQKEKASRAAPPPSPTVFCPFSFPSQTMNLFNMPGFTNFSSFPPGKQFQKKIIEEYKMSVNTSPWWFLVWSQINNLVNL